VATGNNDSILIKEIRASDEPDDQTPDPAPTEPSPEPTEMKAYLPLVQQ
jgi:hypothetical protein